MFFHKLSKEQTATIVDIQLSGLLRRLADRKITWNSPRRPRTSWCRKGMIRYTEPVRSSGRSSAWCSTRSRCSVLDGEFGEGDSVVVDAQADRLGFSKRQTIEAGS